MMVYGGFYIGRGAVRLKAGDLAGGSDIALGFALVRLGGDLVIAAREDDLAYYGGKVLDTLDPVTREFIKLFFR